MTASLPSSTEHPTGRRAGPRPLGRYRYVRLRWRILFALVDRLGWLARRVAARLVQRADAKAEDLEPRSILLVQLDHMGDALITAAVLPALRQRFPQARIDVLAAERNRQVFAACPAVDSIHVSRVNRFSGGLPWGWVFATWWWGRRLRHHRYDLAVDVRGEFPHAVLMWLAGARRRLGWPCGGGGFLLTDGVEFVPGRCEVESRLALLNCLGVDGAAVRRDTPWLDLPVEAMHKADRLLDDRLLDDGLLDDGLLDDGPSGDWARRVRPWFAVHVGAGTQAKRWPAEHWRELLGRLIVELDARVALVGGARDVELVEAVTMGLAWPGVVNLAGQLSLVETASVIQRARMFIGADSGPAHLAAAVGTPAVVLFSGTNQAEQWRPWSSRVAVLRREVACAPCHRQRCPWSEHPCMRGISPSEVMARIESMLDGPPWSPEHQSTTAMAETAICTHGVEAGIP